MNAAKYPAHLVVTACPELAILICVWHPGWVPSLVSCTASLASLWSLPTLPPLSLSLTGELPLEEAATEWALEERSRAEEPVCRAKMRKKHGSGWGKDLTELGSQTAVIQVILDSRGIKMKTWWHLKRCNVWGLCINRSSRPFSPTAGKTHTTCRTFPKFLG